MSTSDDLLASRLRGARPAGVTAQRVVPHRVLRELGRHATAEEVLNAASERLPQLSLPTVYATLDLLGELGLVRRIAAHAAPSTHDLCPEEAPTPGARRCGSVTDIDCVCRARRLRWPRRAPRASRPTG